MTAQIIATTARVRLSWPQQHELGTDDVYRVYSDSRDGDVDYAKAIGPDVDAWPDEPENNGFGLAPFGLGPFGIPAEGPGFGNGPFGLGPFGIEVGMLSFLTGRLADGTWTFAVVGVDAAGNRTTPATIEKSVTVAGEPHPPGMPAVESYDKTTDTAVISFALSSDDTGA